MSKGTTRYTVRLPDDLMTQVATTIYRRNLHSDREPWDLSAFLRVAIREKLLKMERCRKRRAAQVDISQDAPCELQLSVLDDQGNSICPIDGKPCNCGLPGAS